MPKTDYADRGEARDDTMIVCEYDDCSCAGTEHEGVEV